MIWSGQGGGEVKGEDEGTERNKRVVNACCVISNLKGTTNML